jgi:hypothetical protein
MNKSNVRIGVQLGVACHRTKLPFVPVTKEGEINFLEQLVERNPPPLLVPFFLICYKGLLNQRIKRTIMLKTQQYTCLWTKGKSSRPKPLGRPTVSLVYSG